MGPKYKVTGCARFFLFLILFVPAVFFGAAYMRGENGMQIIKDYYHQLLGQKPADPEKKDIQPAEKNESAGHEAELQKELDEAREEIKDLKAKLYEKDQEIEQLKSGKK